MRNPWKLTSFALAGLFVASLGSGAAIADRQPLMKDALRHLSAAESALQNAAHDKGGHRVKALGLTRHAIEEVKKGIRFDNRH